MAKSDEFLVKGLLFEFGNCDSYRVRLVDVTSRDCVRKLIDSQGFHTASTHLDNGVVLYSNTNAPVSFTRGYACNVKDKYDTPYFWSGTFLICGENEDALRDVTDADLTFALEKIKSRCFTGITKDSITILRRTEWVQKKAV